MTNLYIFTRDSCFFLGVRRDLEVLPRYYTWILQICNISAFGRVWWLFRHTFYTLLRNIRLIHIILLHFSCLQISQHHCKPVAQTRQCQTLGTFSAFCQGREPMEFGRSRRGARGQVRSFLQVSTWKKMRSQVEEGNINNVQFFQVSILLEGCETTTEY